MSFHKGKKRGKQAQQDKQIKGESKELSWEDALANKLFGDLTREENKHMNK